MNNKIILKNKDNNITPTAPLGHLPLKGGGIYSRESLPFLRGNVSMADKGVYFKLYHSATIYY